MVVTAIDYYGAKQGLTSTMKNFPAYPEIFSMLLFLA
jgi:hypothetical protein